MVVAIAFFAVTFRIATAPPSESKDIAFFYSHRAVYEQLRTMLLQDEDVAQVATWGVYRPGSSISRMPPEDAMTPARFREYVNLLGQVGAVRVDHDRNSSKILVSVCASGFAGDTRHVAMAWLDHEPANTVESLDAFYKSAKPRKPVYRHVTGNWYIWADW